jgi:hypothetical protein
MNFTKTDSVGAVALNGPARRAIGGNRPYQSEIVANMNDPDQY